MTLDERDDCGGIVCVAQWPLPEHLRVGMEHNLSIVANMDIGSAEATNEWLLLGSDNTTWDDLILVLNDVGSVEVLGKSTDVLCITTFGQRMILGCEGGSVSIMNRYTEEASCVRCSAGSEVVPVDQVTAVLVVEGRLYAATASGGVCMWLSVPHDNQCPEKSVILDAAFGYKPRFRRGELKIKLVWFSGMLWAFQGKTIACYSSDLVEVRRVELPQKSHVMHTKEVCASAGELWLVCGDGRDDVEKYSMVCLDATGSVIRALDQGVEFPRAFVALPNGGVISGNTYFDLAIYTLGMNNDIVRGPRYPQHHQCSGALQTSGIWTNGKHALAHGCLGKDVREFCLPSCACGASLLIRAQC